MDICMHNVIQIDLPPKWSIKDFNKPWTWGQTQNNCKFNCNDMANTHTHSVRLDTKSMWRPTKLFIRKFLAPLQKFTDTQRVMKHCHRQGLTEGWPAEGLGLFSTTICPFPCFCYIAVVLQTICFESIACHLWSHCQLCPNATPTLYKSTAVPRLQKGSRFNYIWALIPMSITWTLLTLVLISWAFVKVLLIWHFI